MSLSQEEQVSLSQEEQDKLDYLINWVTARVDELMPTGQTTNAPVGNIDKELEKAAVYLLRMIRIELAYLVAKPANIADTQESDNSLIIPCPEDYLRFIRVKLTGWKRPVDQLHASNSPVYTNQSNEFMAADPHKPAAALVPHISEHSKQAIECFPKASLIELIYVPRLKPFEMPEDLEDPMVWLAAGRVLTIMRRAELANQATRNGLESIAALRVGLVGEDVPVAEKQ